MKYFQTETHCHTMEVSPCSRVSAKILVEEYIRSDYKYVFITDHYHPEIMESANMANKTWEERINHYLTGYRIAKKEAEGSRTEILLGMEITFNISFNAEFNEILGDDFLVFGFDEKFLLENEYLYKMECTEFHEFAKANNLLVFQAHPYRYGRSPVKPICYDGIEIVNTHPRHRSHNLQAYQYAVENGMYVIGGSDAHAEEDIGRGGVMLPSGITSPADFVQFYRENGSPELIVTFGA